MDQIPFNNGEWLPVRPETECHIYWWSFPWARNVRANDFQFVNNGDPHAVWKFTAGKTTTHLPEHCIHARTTHLRCKALHGRRLTPQTIDFGPEYEGVLEYFTENMLGIEDDIPVHKIGLLNKLFEFTGFKNIPASILDKPYTNVNLASVTDVVGCKTKEIPFGNGQWIPVIPEPEEHVYWWSFPWRYRQFRRSFLCGPQHKTAWKLIAGATITHLPEECIIYMTPELASRFVWPVKLAPQVIDVGAEYESVLEFFTERMLGIDDMIPHEKRGLLDKLFDASGYLRDLPIHDRFGNVVPEKYPM